MNNREPGLRFEGPGEALQQRPSLLIGATALLVGSVSLAGMGTPAWSWFLELGLAGWLVGAFSWRDYRASVKGIVYADESGIRVGEKTIVERSSIAAAFLVSPEAPVVRILRRRAWFSVDVHLESEEQARALLTALGLGIGDSIVTFRASHGSRLRSLVIVMGTAVWLGALVVFLTQLLHHAVSLASWLVLGLVPVIMLFLRDATRVNVGSDGVLIRRFGEQRFVSYASVNAITASGGRTIRLALSSGEDLLLTLGPGGAQGHLRDVLVERLEEARAAFARAGGSRNAEALVDPGGRAPLRWLREVRALASARDYRETRLDEEWLWRVMDDAAASPGVRAGAAVALSALDHASRVRIRVAAEACAEPRLRVALTRVADGATDEELEDALAPLLEAEP
ncbi:MAG TPA: hypothetical protein VGL81_01220 [Polyangiaceae bacterium]